MPTTFDPEGLPSLIQDTSALSLIIPAERSVFLYASFDSAWEQAALIYIDQECFGKQLGSYVLRSTSVTIPPQSADYQLTLVGWHKRSDANPTLPWVASRGRRLGPVVFAWDDSADDDDYRDMRIKLLTS